MMLLYRISVGPGATQSRVAVVANANATVTSRLGLPSQPSRAIDLFVLGQAVLYKGFQECKHKIDWTSGKGGSKRELVFLGMTVCRSIDLQGKRVNEVVVQATN